MFIIGGIFLLILVLVILLYFFLPVLFPQLSDQSTPVPTPIVAVPTPIPSPLPSPIPTPTPSPVPTPVVIINQPPPVVQGANEQLFSGAGFTLTYPENWGVLTCVNSPNFEFDPINNIDQVGAVCNVATKPITVIVQNSLSGCSGQVFQIGRYQVLKTTDAGNGYIENQWCTATNPVLVITNRVSPNVTGVASPIDYSPQIENMIGTLQI